MHIKKLYADGAPEVIHVPSLLLTDNQMLQHSLVVMVGILKYQDYFIGGVQNSAKNQLFLSSSLFRKSESRVKLLIVELQNMNFITCILVILLTQRVGTLKLHLLNTSSGIYGPLL